MHLKPKFEKWRQIMKVLFRTDDFHFQKSSQSTTGACLLLIINEKYFCKMAQLDVY